MQETLHRRVALAALPLLLIQLGLLILWDPMRSGWAFFSLMGCAFIGLGWAARSLRDVEITARQMLAAAALLRIMALPLPPSLSDDIYRYVWDGKVVLAGFNPYALTPDAEQLTHLRDEIWEKTAHRGVETVYPPVAQGLFSIAALAPAPRLALKGMIAGLDLVGCLLLWKIVRMRRIAPVSVLLYAWNPLVVLEGAGMGHIDAAGSAAVIGTVWILLQAKHEPASRLKIGLAGAAAATGVLVKLVPVVALAHWQRVSGGSWFGAVAAICLAVASLPLLVSLGGLPPGLVTYGVSWEFNGPIFEPLYRVIGSLPVASVLRQVLERIEDSSGSYEALSAVYPYLYPQFLAKLGLAAGVAGLVLQSLGSRDVVLGTSRLMRWVLIFSATLYPWYLTWALPWAAIGGHRAWLVLAASIQLAYLPRLVEAQYFPWVYLAIWSPFALALLIERWSGTSAGPDQEKA